MKLKIKKTSRGYEIFEGDALKGIAGTLKAARKVARVMELGIMTEYMKDITALRLYTGKVDKIRPIKKDQ